MKRKEGKLSCAPHADPALGEESGDEGQGQGSQTRKGSKCSRAQGSQPSCAERRGKLWILQERSQREEWKKIFKKVACEQETWSKERWQCKGFTPVLLEERLLKTEVVFKAQEKEGPMMWNSRPWDRRPVVTGQGPYLKPSPVRSTSFASPVEQPHSGGLALPLQEKPFSVPQRTWVGTISIICPVFISFLLLAPRKRQSSLTAHCFFNRKTSSLLSKYGHRVFF